MALALAPARRWPRPLHPFERAPRHDPNPAIDPPGRCPCLAAFARRSRRPPRRRCASVSPRIPTCSTRRSRARFVGRIVFAALCDKLFDIDEKLNIVPQLATGYEWSADSKALTIKLRPGVTFHDGEKFDAAAVKYNIERHKTMAGSNRRGELAPVTSVDVVDPMTVRLNLSAPFSPLLAQLADRAGMMVSPKAAQADGDKFGANPVCSGPFKFVERVAQDRIVLERYPELLEQGRRSISTRSSTRRSSIRRCAWPTCARASSTSSSAWRRRTCRSSRPTRSFKLAQDHRDRLPGHHDQRRQERPGAEEPARQGRRACARPSSSRSTATASSRW